jgi:mono/diheme cytochrome c family protein
MRVIIISLVALTAVAVMSWNARAAAHRQPQSPGVTFAETIAPIVYANCVSCHRPGEAAPFVLTSYEDVAKRARLIAAVTKSRYMPPWHAAPGHGDFIGERRLTDAQIDAIQTWAAQGAPPGDTSKLPALPVFPEGWRLGKPDLVLEMPIEYAVPADGPDIYRNFVIPTGLAEDRWVRAVEFRPGGARRAVHHALFQFIRGGAAGKIDARDGQPGFTGLAPVGFLPQFAPAGELGVWAVGTSPRPLPNGHAVSVPAGSDFVLQLHFHPTGKVERERSTVALYFADRAPEQKLMNMGVPGLFGALARIDIPPGEKNYTITGRLRMMVDMKAYGVIAHAHYLGKEMKAIATFPDGTTQPLLWIPAWDFNWQELYQYKEPVMLPKGTQIDVTISYDNSSDNPRNPSDPPKRVVFGEGSFDEMGGLRFQMATVRKEDEEVLQKVMGAALKEALQRAIKENMEKQKEPPPPPAKKPGGDRISPSR